MEIHHQIMSMIWDHEGQLEKERLEVNKKKVLNSGHELMSQGIYQNQKSSLTFLFTIVEVKMDENFKTDIINFLAGLKKVVTDDKIKIGGEESKR